MNACEFVDTCRTRTARAHYERVGDMSVSVRVVLKEHCGICLEESCMSSPWVFKTTVEKACGAPPCVLLLKHSFLNAPQSRSVISRRYDRNHYNHALQICNGCTLVTRLERCCNALQEVIVVTIVITIFVSMLCVMLRVRSTSLFMRESTVTWIKQPLRVHCIVEGHDHAHTSAASHPK